MKFATRVSLCLLLFLLEWPVFSHAQRANRRPKIELLREIDLDEGRERLLSFRHQWIAGDFSLKYSLQYIPRRGEREEVTGTFWSSNAPDGPVSLIRIHSNPEPEFFLKNGPIASVSSRTGSGGSWKEVDFSDWFKPVDQVVTLTAFDLMMPYIFWDDWAYEGVTKIRGRAAHAFLMLVPGYMRENPLDLHGVVVFLDEDFNALLKADYVTEDETVIKSFRLLDLKKVDDVWLPKTVDYIDEITRDKTRLVITDAAVNLDFSQHRLSLGQIPESVPVIPLSKYKELR